MESEVSLSKWDKRFMALAQQVSTWSKDPSTQTGALLVSPDKRRIFLGYNGFAAGMSDSPELYADREKKYSRVIHCEMNAMMNAQCDLHGFTLYTWPFLSCDRCAVHMIQAGVVRVVAPTPTLDQATRWAAAFEKTKSYFKEANVDIVEYDRDTGKVVYQFLTAEIPTR